MYCGKCGAKNKDGNAFCSSCGAMLDPPPGVSRDREAAKRSGRLTGKGRVLLICALAGFCMLTVALVFVAFTGRGYRRVARDYVKAVFGMDPDRLMEMIPDQRVSAYARENGIDPDSAVRQLRESMEAVFEDYGGDFGKVTRLEVDIDDEEDIPAREVSLTNDTFLQDYGVRLGAERGVSVELEVSGLYGGTEFDFDTTVEVLRIGGGWYVLYPSPYMIYYGMMTDLD